MDGVHTFKRFERGGFPTPYRVRLVCVCRSAGCAHLQCERKTNQWMRVNPLTPERKSKRGEGESARLIWLKRELQRRERDGQPRTQKADKGFQSSLLI